MSPRSRAARIRCWVSHLWGVVPVSALNRRAKVRSLIIALRASDEAVCGSARWATTQVSTGARLSLS